MGRIDHNQEISQNMNCQRSLPRLYQLVAVLGTCAGSINDCFYTGSMKVTTGGRKELNKDNH